MDNIVRMGKTAGVADYVIENVRKRTEQHVKYVRYAHEVGVPIAAGTDAGSILTPHGAAGCEVANLGRIGFSPLDAIRTATETAAKLLRLDDKLGTLTNGKLADVIVVAGDVMSNLALLEDRNNVRRVMIGGQTIVER